MRSLELTSYKVGSVEPAEPLSHASVHYDIKECNLSIYSTMAKHVKLTHVCAIVAI